MLDLTTLRMHFLGPGNYELERALPPGTQTYQCELAPSGHMVVPCCEYQAQNQEEGDLSLLARPVQAPPGLYQ